MNVTNSFQPRILSASITSMSPERFFVEIAPGQVLHYEVSLQGELRTLTREPQPAIIVVSSVEKFGAGYLVEPPVVLEDLKDLKNYVGKFRPIDSTHCTLVASSLKVK